MTGWGQAGPRARQPGHDINYLGPTGALRSIARLWAEALRHSDGPDAETVPGS
jgi:crotonobetainyl-CoA:carnitine CoA-transferase CaiB-like acyl-CoA transferase